MNYDKSVHSAEAYTPTMHQKDTHGLDTVIRSLHSLADKADSAAGATYAIRTQLEGETPRVATESKASNISIGGKIGEALRLLVRINDSLEALDGELTGIQARL